MRLGVLCSGNGTNFENILRSCWEDEVVLMIHNKEKCGAAKRAEKFGVPHCYISHKNEDQIIQLMQAWRVDLIVLAGYMKVISPEFVKAFPNRIINLHPSLLPKYKGLHAIEQALESGDTKTGCTVHYVNDELDSGEVIMQLEVPIEPDDTVETLTPRIQRQEYAILPAAIKQVKQRIPVAIN
jgi:formyltetrahydrofolate-dependent phosphoribosylglycinamide formyltransferase|tara:strand:- start:1051 stop:1599 length:549 start_codon:yes stop_codon:yes gene_type:complete